MISLYDFIGRKLRPIELRLLAKWFLKIRRKTITLRDDRLYTIDPISDLGLRLLKSGKYEEEMTYQISKILNKGDSFIDLGANEGYFTILGGKLCGENGVVFSIEPQKRLWPIITENIFLNNLNNVHLLPYGFGAEERDIKLQLYPDINSGATGFTESFNFKIAFSHLRKRLYGNQKSRITVLDSIIGQIRPPIKLIKIDIEGFELEALKGAKKILKERIILHYLIEIHPNALARLNQREVMIDKLMKKNGYQKQRIAQNLNLYSV